jgi:O-succinylbenzoic acid--CoA ligase
VKQSGTGIAGLLLGDQICPTNIALISSQGCFSYAQLDQWVEQLCVTLSALDVEPGMTIGCADENRLLNTLLLHSLPRLGCAFLPLDPSLPDSSLHRIVALGEVDMLVAADALVEGIPWLEPQQFLAVDTRPGTQSALLSPLPGGQPHWLVATSGTEGEGSLVVLTGDQLMSSVRASRERLAFTDSDSWLLCLPMFHVGGLMIPLRCAEAGATLVVHETFDPERLWRDLHGYEITHVSLVPAMLAKLLEHYAGQPPPRHLRVMLAGGGALSPGLAQAVLDAGWPLCPSYGMTETASQVATVYPPPCDYTAGVVGRPLSHLQLKIEPTSGRIMIKGNSVMQGYAGQPMRDDDWLVTSDLGELDEQGNLIVLGRADEMLISGGENVHPQQVENLLVECPCIQDVALTAVADPVWGDGLVALYSGDLSSEELRAWSRTHLPGFMRPKEFVRVDALPRTTMGKLRRRALPDLYESVQSTED